MRSHPQGAFYSVYRARGVVSLLPIVGGHFEWVCLSLFPTSLPRDHLLTSPCIQCWFGNSGMYNLKLSFPKSSEKLIYTYIARSRLYCWKFLLLLNFICSLKARFQSNYYVPSAILWTGAGGWACKVLLQECVLQSRRSCHLPWSYKVSGPVLCTLIITSLATILWERSPCSHFERQNNQGYRLLGTCSRKIWPVQGIFEPGHSCTLYSRLHIYVWSGDKA